MAVDETKGVGTELLVEDGLAVAVLDVLVVPSCRLVMLGPGHPVGLIDVEEGRGDETASDQVYGIVVAQVHRGPPDPEDVAGKEAAEPGEAVAKEQGLDDGVSGMERGEGTEGNRRGREVRRVHVEAEDLVDTGKASGGPGHAVDGRRQAMLILVPRRGTREEELNRDTSDVHPAKGLGKGGTAARGTKDEQDANDDSRECEVQDAVGDPGNEVKSHVSAGGENIGEIGTIKDVLEGRKNTDPDVRANFCGNESATK